MSKKYNPIQRLNFVLIATIGIGEALIMFVLPSFGKLPNLLTVFLDMALLMLITIPIVKWLVIKPMKKYLQDLEQARQQITAKENQMLSALNSLAKARDNETGAHIIRTQKYVKLLADRIRSSGYHLDFLTEEHIARLVKVAPLHDLGKVGIPDQILKKAGRLTGEELEIIQGYPLIGESILSTAQSDKAETDLISVAIKVAGSHHEKWDGTGYPRNLAGENIPLEGRIMAIADVFDALVSERTYKKAWTIEEACTEITSKRGTAFDPIVVDAFIAERQQFESIARKS